MTGSFLVGLLALWACSPGAPSGSPPPENRPAAAAATSEPMQSTAPSKPVERLKVRVLATIPHDTNAYTQGLVWTDGALYESAGQYGESTLRQVDPKTGQVLRSVAVPPSYFAEGLA
ncbi:MAG TPA: glutaminyl-peptide cyclotransferase, partial [Thermoanaerobaculia bacterium]|nr:glutaminyl-peptide cyclotransferase [Thermoanaerobaculia bacterium]